MSSAVKALMQEARGYGAGLWADGMDLVVVEQWGRILPALLFDEEHRRHAGAVIVELRRESHARGNWQAFDPPANNSLSAPAGDDAARSRSAIGRSTADYMIRKFVMDSLRDKKAERKRGRKPIGQLAMTPAERQQRRRDRIKEAQPAWGSTDDFRLELRRWIDSSMAYRFTKLTKYEIGDVLDEMRRDLHIEYYRENPEDCLKRSAAKRAQLYNLLDGLAAFCSDASGHRDGQVSDST
jgi:hypothetical protein